MTVSDMRGKIANFKTDLAEYRKDAPQMYYFQNLLNSLEDSLDLFDDRLAAEEQAADSDRNGE